MSFSNFIPANPFRDRIIFEMEKYDFHFIKFEELVDEKITELKTKVPDLLNPEEKSQYENWISDEIFYYSQSSSILYNNILIAYYSYLESTFYKMCFFVQSELNLELKVNDIRGESYIHQFRKYFEKVASLKFSKELEVLWQRINDLREIRNLIVHNLSSLYRNNEFVPFNNLSKKEKKYYNLFKNNPNIYFYEKTGEFSLSFEFVKENSRIVFEFLIGLSDIIYEKVLTK